MDDDTFLGLFRVDPGDRGERPGMTPFAIRVEHAAQRCQQAPRRGRAPDVAADVRRASTMPTSRSRTSRTACTCRRSRRTPLCEPASTGTSATPGGRMRPSRRRGRRCARSRTRSCGPRGARPGCTSSSTSARRTSRTASCAASRSTTSARSSDLLDPDALTLGFARRLATYKRLHLLAHDPERARRIMSGPHPVQLLVAGKAHPADGPGKDTLQRLYNLKREENVVRRAADRSSRTTTSRSRSSSSPAATSGSTCRGGRWRRAARAA